MPVFIAALIGGLVSAAGSFVGRVLLSLGIGFVSYTGIEASIGFAVAFLMDSLEALPPHAVQIAGRLKLGVCVSILSSAVLVRMTLAGLTNGTITRMVQR